MVDGASERPAPAGRKARSHGSAVERRHRSNDRIDAATLHGMPGISSRCGIVDGGVLRDETGRERRIVLGADVEAFRSPAGPGGFGGQPSCSAGPLQPPEFVEGTLPEMNPEPAVRRAAREPGTRGR